MRDDNGLPYDNGVPWRRDHLEKHEKQKNHK
jgi:hypothetical protein